MILKIKLGAKTLKLDPDRLTLGEAHLMKHEFGMEGFGDLSVWDPDQLLGFATIAVKRANKDLTLEDAKAQAEGVEFSPIFEDILAQVQAEEEKVKAAQADPPQAAESTSAPVAANGSPGTSPKTRGRRRSTASTG